MKYYIFRFCHIAFLMVMLSCPAYAQEKIAPPPAEPSPLAIQTTSSDTSSHEIWTPANPKPLQAYTSYYTQKTATVLWDDEQYTLTYFMFMPQQQAESKKYPLVLVLHDASGLADAGKYLITESVGKPYPAFIVIPALPSGKRWADPGELKLVHALPQAVALVKQLMEQHPIDPARIYVIGCGTGGTGAYGAAQLYSDIFAAAVPISATWNPRETSHMAKVAVAAFHGGEDRIVPFASSRDTITVLQQSGATAYFTKYELMGNDCGSEQFYTDLLWKWLFEQRKQNLP